MKLYAMGLVAVVATGMYQIAPTSFAPKADRSSSSKSGNAIHPAERPSAHPRLSGLWKPSGSRSPCSHAYIRFGQHAVKARGMRTGLGSLTLASVEERGSLLDITLRKGSLSYRRTSRNGVKFYRTSESARRASLTISLNVSGSQMSFVSAEARDDNGTIIAPDERTMAGFAHIFNLTRCEF